MTSRQLTRLKEAMQALEADLAAGRAGEAQIESVVREMEKLVRQGWRTMNWWPRLHCLYKVWTSGGSVRRCIPYGEAS